MDPEVPGSNPGGGTISAPSADALAPFSAHARYAAHTAAKLGYVFEPLDVDGYAFAIRDGARVASFSAGAGTPYALNRAHAAALARDKSFAQAVLARAGLPTIPSHLFFVTTEHASLRSAGREPSDALAFAARATYPIFCKPIDGSLGAFAEIIADAAQFERYMQRVGAKHYAILVQPVIEAREHRAFVLRGQALFSYEKESPSLVGDGVSTLTALRSIGAAETLRARDAHGAVYRALDVPPAGAALFIEGPRNRAAGGGAVNVSDVVRTPLAKLALEACAALDLELGAVDMFERGGELIILEVNSNPAIKTLESHNRWDLIETIWSANIEAAFAR